MQWDGKRLAPVEIGILPHPDLTKEVCMAVLKDAGTPEQVVAHCRAVAEEAMQLAGRIPAEKAVLDRDLLFAAAMLHDVARTEPSHADTGAAWVRALGYPEVADLIARHHDCDGSELNEASVLYLADKYRQGTARVTLEERFAVSAARCESEEAKSAHERRYGAAVQIEQQIFRR